MKRFQVTKLGTTFLVVGLLLLTLLPPGLAATEGVQAFGNVFVIVGENTELSQLNMTTAPYIIGMIKPASAWLTDYFAVTHHSEANYVAMTSGQFTVCQQNNGPVASCSQKVSNLFHQLDDANLSWRSWMESMPQSCYLLPSGSEDNLNVYTPTHNPALFYDDLVTAGTVPSDECLQRDIPAGTTGPNDMSAFNAALASGNVARFNYIVPNNCENGHSNCSPGNQITQFDTFLASEVPLIIASTAYGSDGVIIVTFDEGIYAGRNVMFAVISPLVKVGVYSGLFDHYSFLRTMEDGLRLTGFLGNATTARPISAIWTQQTGIPEFNSIVIIEVFALVALRYSLRRRFRQSRNK